MRIDTLEGTDTMEGTDGATLMPWQAVYHGHSSGIFPSFHAGASRSVDGSGTSWAENGAWPEYLIAFVGPEDLCLAQGDRTLNNLTRWSSRPLSGLLFEAALGLLTDEPASDPEQIRVRVGRGVCVLQSAGRVVVVDYANDIAWRTVSTASGLGEVSSKSAEGVEAWSASGYAEVGCAEFGGIDVQEVAEGQYVLLAGEGTLALVGRAMEDAHFAWPAAEVDLAGLVAYDITWTEVLSKADGTIALAGVSSSGTVIYALLQPNIPWDGEEVTSLANWAVVDTGLSHTYPRTCWAPDGALWVVVGGGMVRVPDPAGAPAVFESCCSTGTSEAELSQDSDLLPFGEIRDAVFDSHYLYVLQDVNPPFPGGSALYAMDLSGRVSLWRRHYRGRAYCITKTSGRFPASAPVFPGRSPSPPLGEGPDGSAV